MMVTIGVDLGTSYASVAAFRDGKPVILPNREGARRTPAIVALSKSGEWWSGQAAKRQAVTNPRGTFWDFLRLLGERFDSPAVRSISTLAPFEVVEGQDGYARLQAQGTALHPATLVAILLAALKRDAEMALRVPVGGAVIAVPPMFHLGQEQLVRDASRLAGFEWVLIQPSTTLAALAPRNATDSAKRIALCDLGGGSFSVSLVEDDGQVCTVLSTEWERFVGGEDFDQLLVRYLLERLGKEERLDASRDPLALVHFKEAAESAKRRLSVLAEVRVEVPLGGDRLWTPTLRRTELESQLAPQLEWIASPCKKALQGAGLTKQKIDVVLLFGGSSRIPKVNEMLSGVFEKDPTPGLHPDDAPALGAAVRAAMLEGDRVDRVLMDVSRHHVAVEGPPGRITPILSRHSGVPSRATCSFETTDSRLELNILQGTSERVEENLFLGRLLWEVPFRHGPTAVVVAVEVDVAGNVSVEAGDVASGLTRQILLRAGGSLGDDDRERTLAEVRRSREGYVAADQGRDAG
ncbi:MAG TPA: Hsp70 family protein [Vicinamibacteria bacterium]|nr:Hsp70 family protein [Vicinamibacteria bacterium]